MIAISEYNVQISFKFYLLLPLSHTLGRFLNEKKSKQTNKKTKQNKQRQQQETSKQQRQHILALLGYAIRGHEIEIRPSSVRQFVSQLSLYLMHRFLSNFLVVAPSGPYNLDVF